MDGFGSVQLVNRDALEKLIQSVNVEEIWVKDVANTFVLNTDNVYVFISDRFTNQDDVYDNFYDDVGEVLHPALDESKFEVFPVDHTDFGRGFNKYKQVMVYKDGKWLV